MNETDVKTGVLYCIKTALKWDVALMSVSEDLKIDYGADTFELFLLYNEIKKYFQLPVNEEQMREYRTIDALTKAVMKLKQTEETKST